jgi:hypothetical protein
MTAAASWLASQERDRMVIAQAWALEPSFVRGVLGIRLDPDATPAVSQPQQAKTSWDLMKTECRSRIDRHAACQCRESIRARSVAMLSG